ncbi:SAM-dependent methyltransferase [Sphingomonas sp. IBVSS1]|nr:SAM-dependent methyltransferase [Sphingomonas sp. IBVSS1]
MTPHQFVEKWRNAELKERTASQSHFNDLCALLGLKDPISEDPKGEYFTFEKGATKTSGGEGWADVWRKGCFAWEYKGKAANLDKAYDQLLRYSIALESPPLLIVSDMDRIRIHTNFTNTVQAVHEITLDDLLDAGKRDLLRACFEHPEQLRPAKTRQKLTEDAAEEFAAIAQRLRSRGHDAHIVAHFVNRLVFCMFAEDVGLLPHKMFQRMLEASRNDAAQFAPYATTLFAAMKSGGMVGFEKVEWFNGGLFDDDAALPLEKADIDNLLAAAKLDWSEIDPSILGTLFERGLDPAKRSQLGAHYTDRDKIMMIVRPVIIEPLEREWVAVRAGIEAAMDKADAAKGPARAKAQAEAAKLMGAWRDRLANFRVLDPACGSGNFLYLSLLALKDIEHRTALEAEQLGLPREFPRLGPENVLGIELNPYAAELARVSVWIGEIQWMRRNGFDAARNPILRTLNNIECRDAVLTPDGTPATWPVAEVVVGNPPFLGDKKMVGELGEDYTKALRKAWPQVPGGADLVCYWFASAWQAIQAGNLKRAGLVATNSIRGGANRAALKPIVEQGGIFDAWSDQPWTVDGAAVRVSLVAFDMSKVGPCSLDGHICRKILSDLTEDKGGIDLTLASSLESNYNIAFIGDQKSGPFDIDGSLARELLTAMGNPNGRPNSDVVFPWLNGMDVTRRSSGRWIIDFGTNMPLEEAQLYEAPFEIVLREVKPTREGLRRANHREKWWIHGEARPGMRRALRPLARFLITPRVSKHRFFVWGKQPLIADSRLAVLALSSDEAFGILSSTIHEKWTLATCSWHGVGNDPTYNAQSCFETFPFPAGLTPDVPAAAYAHDPRAQAIAKAAARLNELRENWLNPADLVVRVPEVVPGYPDRILPKDEAAAKLLARRTLTNLYNERPAWLDHAHRALDEAVADAYGWGDDWRAGALHDDEILARLFRLNQERAGKG